MSSINAAEIGKTEQKILKVGSSTIVEKLSTAISTCFEKEGVMPVLRCVGASAINQAIKAVIVSNQSFIKRGMTALILPGFGSITENEREVTCVDLSLRLERIK